jgi:natural resistance-associated macrophage protein
VVDKRITTRFLGYERTDTALGTVLFAVGALFAIVLGAGSVLGASAVTLATSYAVGDYFGLRHSLHRRWREARTFHHTYAACVLAAAAVVLIPQVPLGLLTTVVQALAGILLPSATVFLLLLCNDHEVLGPLVNPRWLNVLAAAVIGALLGLSALLTATTIVPRLPLVPAVTGLAVAIAVLAACATVIAVRVRPAPAQLQAPGAADRRTWTMPPIESLRPPARSAWRTLGLVILRCYPLAAIIVLAVRAIQLALGAG